MIREDIKRILEIAVHAPSGDNCQPWRFEVRGDDLFVINLDERDDSLYNWGQRASFIAHGALLENIHIIAPGFGYEAQSMLFPELDNKNIIAIVRLAPATPAVHHPLFGAISSRVTNRKPYQKIPLTVPQRQSLLSVPVESERVKIILIEDSMKRKRLAQAASVNERLLFENKKMHDFLFNHIIWTAEEDESRRLGFYIKTFELPPPAVLVFKLAQSWSRLHWLNKLGLSQMIAKQNAALYSKSSAIGACICEKNTPENFVNAGRVFQRLWLTVSSLGLSLQPITGIGFLALRLQTEGNDFISEQHNLIREAHNELKEVFGFGEETLAIAFRIGHGGEPSARSLRLQPDIRYI